MTVSCKSLLLLLLLCSPLIMTNIYAQNEESNLAQDGPLKVAVFDPVGKVEEAIRQIVREEISSVLVNRNGYTVLERQLINKVMEENKFQGEGMVDESQISEIGKIMGADYVFISMITPLKENYYLSCKMIEVATARIEKQFTGMTKSGIIDIPQTTQYVMTRLLVDNVKQQTVNAPNRSETAAVSSTTIPPETSSNSKKPVTTNSKQSVTTDSKQTIATESQIQNDDAEMVYIEPPGRKGVYIGKFELTQSQWQKNAGKNPSIFKGPNNPVENISLNSILDFIKKLNKKTGKKYRLPTEEEWLYAANGGENRDQYEFSGSNDANEVAWYLQNSNKQSNAVGLKKPNSIGIYDMSGNVGEWCTYDYGRKYIVLGGSFVFSQKSCSLLEPSRISISDKKEYTHIGFRLVIEE